MSMTMHWAMLNGNLKMRAPSIVKPPQRRMDQTKLHRTVTNGSLVIHLGFKDYKEREREREIDRKGVHMKH